MRRLNCRTPRATAALLLLLASSVLTQAQTPAPAAAQPGAITGRVTTDDGRPAANVSLALLPADFQPDRRTLAQAATDSDGRFVMSNVPAGRYRLLTLTPAHTAPDLRGSSFDTGKLINVDSGETVEGADFVLTRGGVITGRVTTADGKPAIGERISVAYAGRPDLRGTAARAVRPFDWETDDRGVYRIYGLAPGRYLVSVGQDNEGGIVVGAASARYARTFHPGTTDPAQARAVEVSSGGETSGVDIALAEAPKSFQATGRVIDADTGKAVADVGVGFSALRPDQRSIGGWGWDGMKTNQSGEFAVKNLMPGRYAAFVVGFGQQDSYSEPAQFEITDGDISDLAIRLRRGGSISGTAIVEGTTDRAIMQKITELQVFASVTSAKPDQLAPVVMNDNRKIAADGSFRVAGLAPGKVRLTVGSFPPVKGFTLLRVERGGVEVPREGIEVGPGEHLMGFRIVIGYGTGVVRGQINVLSAGQPAALPEGTRLTASVSRVGAAPGSVLAIGGANVDARGRFVIEGLLAGEYELTVRAYLPSAPAQRFPVFKQPLQVTDGGEASVIVNYDLGKTTEPNQ